MADEQTPKKVVKRVVKRPIAPSSSTPKPQVRYGRPAASPAKVAARDEPAPAPPTTPAQPKLKTKATPKSKPAVPRPTITAPTIDLKPAIASARERTGGVASAVGSRASRAGRATRRFTADRWAAARAWRIPTIPPIRAALITGLLMGLLSVGLGVLALRIFTELRGVASGGGTWGSLTFVVVTFIAFAAGERLLDAFGAPMPRLTSLLGILITIMAILGIFLEATDSTLGLVIVPVLGAGAFAAAHWVLTLVESSPEEGE